MCHTTLGAIAGLQNLSKPGVNSMVNQGETKIKKSACPSGKLLFHCTSPKLWGGSPRLIFLKQDFHILNNALLVLLNCAQLESHSMANYHDCALYSFFYQLNVKKLWKYYASSVWHITIICLINCAQTCVKFCTYSKHNSTFEEAGTKVGPDQLGRPILVGSTRIDSDQLGSNEK